ncbi:hypothetical protein EIP91_000154 [Steccherinum ochraceum]|uniref:Major facilitator superfamily (MFS) profile domain-containing protein n=1 Tax=Steccherinum ochraceum TaxID=92696 RepID=A0A4R0RV20_9APHY|nr:hypothetical protein EIP91_000154 [Steccherinum ochraceum]
MSDAVAVPSEREPLLSGQEHGQSGRASKPFFRPRPLWLAPFVVVASIIRGMTLAPRVQVFTQLSCNIVYGNDKYDHTRETQISAWNVTSPTPAYLPLSLEPFGPYVPYDPIEDTSTTFRTSVVFDNHSSEDAGETRPRRPEKCSKDPEVQAVAARLQTVMAMTVGTLCALSTGWWGHFGERHGRTRVLAAATLGLFLTDVTFILVSTPHSIFAAHGQLMLLIAPIIEGLLGGWTTLQAATSAYVSDCTSDGSRAHVFSRFSGVFFLGLSLGPTIGAFFIRHPILPGAPSEHVGHDVPEVTSVFYIAAMCSFVNLLLVLFVFPESLDKKKAKQAALAARLAATGAEPASPTTADAPQAGHLERLLSPLTLFVPKMVPLPGGGKKRDWTLTILSTTLFMFLLSTGIFQLKYLYAEHTYGWGAEQLSYYISVMGAVRAVNLLILMPYLISRFKPKSETRAAALPAASASLARIIGKPKPTLSQLHAEMSFDIILVRVSLCIDFCSHFFVFLSPVSAGPVLFVLFTSMSSLGAGVHPAVNSIALCVLQIRQYAAEDAGEVATQDDGGAGRLFGALSVLQSVGQSILGPMLFGLIYGTTVAHYPKAIYSMAAGIITVAIALTFTLRPEHRYRHLLAAHTASGSDETAVDAERGRSRRRKSIVGTSPTIGTSESSYGSPTL